MTRVAQLIRDARRQAGLSQAQLAAAAKTSQPAVARYEAGRAAPSLATLERLLAGCGSTLVVGTDARRRKPERRKTEGRIALVRRSAARLEQAAQRRGVGRIRVFGSVARGDETSGSDVDLLVDLDPGRTVLDLIGFQQDAEEILGVPVDVATARYMKPRLRTRALREARPV